MCRAMMPTTISRSPGTLTALQRMALVFILHIATAKLRVFDYCGIIPPPPLEYLLNRSVGWVPAGSHSNANLWCG